MALKHKILCIDDEQDIVDALFRLLRKDYEVLTATSGSEGLQILKDNEVSLIISDQKMPEMNGVETLKRSIEINPDCIRILLTGYTDIESVIDSINSGEVYRYITKPWDPIDLVNTVNKSIEKYEIKSELKQKNKELKKAYDELKGLDQAKTQFMYLINHELKTPLTVLTSYTDLLAESKMDDEQKMFVKKVQKSNDKLALIVNESLTLLKAETGKLEINLQNTKLKPIIENLENKFKDLLNKKELKLNSNLQTEDSFNCDDKILEDILYRLIDNAIKFADNNTKVHLDITEANKKYEFSVSNTGKEVKQDLVDKLLKPFHLDEEMMNHSQGLGMGLSLCQAYLKNFDSQLNIITDNKLFKVSFII